MDHETVEEAILTQARRELDEWSEGNPQGYGSSAADDVTYFDNIGAQTRLDGVQAFREYLAALQGQVPEHNYEIVDPKVQVYGDIGILSMHYHGFSAEGETLGRAKGTSVYRQSDGAWRMVHTHWSTQEEV